MNVPVTNGKVTGIGSVLNPLSEAFVQSIPGLHTARRISEAKSSGDVSWSLEGGVGDGDGRTVC